MTVMCFKDIPNINVCVLHYSVFNKTFSRIFKHMKVFSCPAHRCSSQGIFSDTFISILTDLPNDMAWGDKKNIFYNSDYVTKSKHFSFYLHMYDTL